jgi:hypothetical protein
VAKKKFPRALVKLDELPGSTFRSEVVEVAEDAMKEVSKRMASKAGGELVTQTDPSTGQETPRDTTYQAGVPIDDPHALLRLGLRGTGRVYLAWQPLGTRLARLVANTFNFKL